MNVKHNQRSLIKRLFREYVRGYGGSLSIAVFFMLVAAAMTAAVPMLVQPVLDEVLYGKKEELILPVAGLMTFVFVVRGIATYIHTVMMSRIGEWIIGDLQKDLFAHFIHLDLSFHQQHPSTQLLSRIVNDVQMVRTAITDTMTGFGKSLITLVFLIAVMFYQEWHLAGAAIFIFPLAVLFVAWIGKRLRKISGRIQEEMGQMTENLAQILQGIRLVKAYGQEELEKQKAQYNIEKVRSLMVKSVRVGQLSTPVNEIMVGLSIFGIIVYGGFQVADGNLSPGNLIAFIMAFTLAYEPMKKLARLNNSLQMGLGAADRVFDMIDQPVAISNVANKAGGPDLSQARIVFEDVGFFYEDPAYPILKNMTLSAEPGQVTALIGPSGAGKSTVFNLILRFFEANKGHIRINDTDIHEIDCQMLRENTALVAQDITLFNDTVAANIAYGKRSATDKEIQEAARLAAADEFIRQLPEGYQTVLGERGTRLSGGQRQRIAIARAMLRDAPILLLDEATSALDNESEAAIQQALKDLQKDRTTLVIAHRLSTIQEADQILVMEQGQIIETGSHQELLARKGAYANMIQTLGQTEHA